VAFETSGLGAPTAVAAGVADGAVVAQDPQRLELHLERGVFRAGAAE
jgi:hypothetical protein